MTADTRHAGHRCSVGGLGLADVSDGALDRLRAGQVTDGDRRTVEVARVDGRDAEGGAERARLHAAEEAQPVVPAGVVDQAGVDCAVWLYVAGALTEDDSWIGVGAIQHVIAGRHQGGLDGHGRPVRVCLLEQGAEAGDMRAGHRGAAVEVEAAPGVARRGDSRQDVLARGDQVGLEQVAVAGTQRAARGERSRGGRRQVVDDRGLGDACGCARSRCISLDGEAVGMRSRARSGRNGSRR